MFGGAAMNGSPTYAGGGARGVDGNDAGRLEELTRYGTSVFALFLYDDMMGR
jgi:hypothetical protein